MKALKSYRVEVHPENDSSKNGSHVKCVDTLNDVRAFCKEVGKPGDGVVIYDQSKGIVFDPIKGCITPHKKLVI